MSSVREVVNRFWAAQTTGDVPTAASLFAADATWTVVGRGAEIAGTYPAPDGLYGELAPQLIGLFEPGQFSQTVTSVWVDEDEGVGVTEFHDSGSAVNGHRFELDAVAVFQVTDGKIAAVREYVDLSEVALARV
jgi:ketosteroid isomerase-like protein